MRLTDVESDGSKQSMPGPSRDSMKIPARAQRAMAIAPASIGRLDKVEIEVTVRSHT
jgi:hypothetical protein